MMIKKYSVDRHGYFIDFEDIQCSNMMPDGTHTILVDYDDVLPLIKAAERCVSSYMLDPWLCVARLKILKEELEKIK